MKRYSNDNLKYWREKHWNENYENTWSPNRQIENTLFNKNSEYFLRPETEIFILRRQYTEKWRLKNNMKNCKKLHLDKMAETICIFLYISYVIL